MSIFKFKFDRKNYRRHCGKNKKLINNSLAETALAQHYLQCCRHGLFAFNGV
ncbi:MAG: hypothetical protein J5706_08955 [Elusimicrobiales bacterium]|nr:hypothetical protein [Elusimicrobiales bacterium]